MEKIVYASLIPMAVGIFFVVLTYSPQSFNITQEKANYFTGVPSILILAGTASTFLFHGT